MTDNLTSTFYPRIFVIGTNRIVEDESTVALDNEQMRNLLRANYPEVANATIRERTDASGSHVVEFLPLPGRKG
jgi:hypothetical protein